jgi:hypothetical protein
VRLDIRRAADDQPDVRGEQVLREFVAGGPKVLLAFMGAGGARRQRISVRRCFLVGKTGKQPCEHTKRHPGGQREEQVQVGEAVMVAEEGRTQLAETVTIPTDAGTRGRRRRDLDACPDAAVPIVREGREQTRERIGRDAVQRIFKLAPTTDRKQVRVKRELGKPTTVTGRRLDFGHGLQAAVGILREELAFDDRAKLVRKAHGQAH